MRPRSSSTPALLVVAIAAAVMVATDVVRLPAGPVEQTAAA